MNDVRIQQKSTLAELIDRLNAEQARKIDLVIPAVNLSARDGNMVVRGAEPIMGDTGVTVVDGEYAPTKVMLEGLAAKLDVPIKYLRRLHEERTDIFDANVNGWLQGRKPHVRYHRASLGKVTPEVLREGVEGDTRSFLLRAFAAGEDGVGTARSLHSDRYRVTHYLDSAMATLTGLRAAGLDPETVKIGAQITERRMVIDVEAPQVTAVAREFLKGYRSPWNGKSGDELPFIHAGVRVMDSEVGNGAYSTVPFVKVQICDNGMTMQQDLVRNVHLGARMDEGIVTWGEDTEAANREVISLQVRDAVSTFLNKEYMAQVARRLDEEASKEVRGLDRAQDVVKRVGVKQGYTKEQQKGIVDFFMQSGQFTSAGVANAVTAYSQTIPDVDEAVRLESTAFAAMAAV